MNSRKRRADVSVRDLQRTMENEAHLCQSEIQAATTAGENKATAEVNGTRQETAIKETPVVETAGEETPVVETAGEETPVVETAGKETAETSKEDAKKSSAEEAVLTESADAETAQKETADGETSLEGKETGVEEKRGDGEREVNGVKSPEPETAKDDGSTPFKIGGSVFGNFKLPSLPVPTPEAPGTSPESPSLDLKEGGEGDERIGNRPKTFPGEEDEELILSEANISLLKCVNVATGEEAPKFKFQALGHGIVRLLKSKSEASRLIFRQTGTWHLLLNTPIQLVTKPEKIDTATNYLIKFFAYDMTKEKETNKLSVYCLKFPDQKSRDDLHTHFMKE